MLTYIARYELKSGLKHGHFAVSKLEVSVNYFDEAPAKHIIEEELFKELSIRASASVRQGITSALSIWYETKYQSPNTVRVKLLELEEQLPHSSSDDIQVAIAMSFLIALLEIAVSQKVVSAEQANDIRERLEVILDYGGKAVIHFNEN